MGLATFNWSYKPGVANKYNEIIPAGADNIKPAGITYVAHWGSDISGNGSRQYPYKTVSGRGQISGVVIVGSGTYRETINGANNTRIIGDGNVIFDVSHFNYLFSANVWLYNIKVKGTGNSVLANVSINDINIEDCVLDGISTATANSSVGEIKNTTFKNIQTTLYLASRFVNRRALNNTFISCNNVQIQYLSNNIFLPNASIFKNCNISTVNLNAFLEFRNCVFYHCNFKMTNGLSQGGSLYPTVPAGYTHFSNISDFNTALNNYLGISRDNPNNLIADPLFNNEVIGDYTLSFSSPAKNLSYFGTYVGAYSIGTGLKVRASDALSNFDNSSAVNLAIQDDSLTLIDVNQISTIVTKPIDNTAGREIAKLPVFGFNADRNGEYVDSTADLSETTISAGTGLSASTPYLVEVGSIIYNGQVYQPGDRFTSLSSSPGTFTTTNQGVVREILEAPARENLQARFSGGAETTINNAGALTVGNWYYVEQDEVSYNGDTYAVGTFLKCVAGVTSFTGDGVVREVFADADPFFYFEINQKPTSNNVGNSRTGDILRGNGDKDFDRTAANVFPISRKFIQIKYTIQVNNLTP